MHVLTRVVLNSMNAKDGKAACVYRTQTSCPATCPLMGSGCYGENRADGRYREPLRYAPIHDRCLQDSLRFIPPPRRFAVLAPAQHQRHSLPPNARSLGTVTLQKVSHVAPDLL